MMNLSMERKLRAGEAIDVSKCKRNTDGDYILTEFNDNTDYCDAKTETWIWSIGKSRETGIILASSSTKFYNNPKFECLFLR